MKKILSLPLLTISFFATAQNVGIGTTTPLTKLHVFNGASGATPFVFSPLVVESSGHTYINLLSPAANETAILFGQPGSAANGVIMYNTAGTTNGFQFRNNGNQTRMVIDNAGNVGIGTTTPAFPLSFGTALGDKISLWSNLSNSYGFGIQSGLLQIHTDISSADIAFGYGSSSAFTEALRIKGNGNVGIGTTNPNAALGFPAVLGKKITLYPGSTGDVGWAVQGNLLQMYADNPNADIAFGYDQAGVFTERMRVKGDGNVGIGLTNPTATLEVIRGTGSGGTAVFRGTTNMSHFNYGTDEDTYIRAGKNNRYVILNDIPGGRVGAGTASPLSTLHVFNGSSGNSSPFSPLAVESNTNTYVNLLSPNANETGILFGKAENAASGGIIYNSSAVPSMPNGFQFRVNGNQIVASLNSDGNMGIGMGALSPSRLTLAQRPGNDANLLLYLLNSSGNGVHHWRLSIGIAAPFHHLQFTSNNTTVSYIDYSTGNYVAISDKSYKRDIQSLQSVLPKMMQLNPVSYRMKEQVTDEATFGFLAQELQQVFPETVKTFEKDGKLGISYTQLIPLTVAAIQEQQKTIDRQQQQIDELKKSVEKLLKQ